MADFWDGGVALEYDGASLAAYPGGYGLWRDDYDTPRYALLGSKVRYELRNDYSGSFQSTTVTTPRAWAVTDLVRMAGIAGPLLLSFIRETTQSYALCLYVFAFLFIISFIIAIILKIKTTKKEKLISSKTIA